MDDLRYPIGPFQLEGEITADRRREWIVAIAATPAVLADAIAGLSPDRLDAPYRPGGWTVRQVVHHLPDSHLHAYTRFKFALTEDTPTIKPYDEARWAELPDGRSGPVEPSLRLLEGLHARWVLLLERLEPADFARAFVHPEHGRALRLGEVLAMYAWHGRHHVAQVTRLRARMGW